LYFHAASDMKLCDNRG